MPRDGQLQQYNTFTPQTRARGTRRRKIRDEEERIARTQKCVQTTQHPEGNTTTAKRSPYYWDFPESQWCNIHPTDNDSHAYAGLMNSDIICYSNSILQVIAVVFIWRNPFWVHQAKSTNVDNFIIWVCKCDSFHGHWQTGCCQSLQVRGYFHVWYK